jgi:hypothetical protein
MLADGPEGRQSNDGIPELADAVNQDPLYRLACHDFIRRGPQAPPLSLPPWSGLY